MHRQYITFCLKLAIQIFASQRAESLISFHCLAYNSAYIEKTNPRLERYTRTIHQAAIILIFVLSSHRACWH
ncbi:hypothetical protein CW304_14955 [Bacillus sp. UFRGS-B20]|nr:hypothetical protein CW304_14955 [Bacillus sp. UFRGS-B20]